MPVSTVENGDDDADSSFAWRSEARAEAEAEYRGANG